MSFISALKSVLLNKKPNEILDPFLLIKLGLYKITNSKLKANPMVVISLATLGTLKTIDKRIKIIWPVNKIKKQKVQSWIFLK